MKHLIQLIKKNKAATFSVVVIIGVLSAVFFGRLNRSNPEDDMVKLTSRAISIDGGWGYEVLADGKVYIRQEYIPAIQGRKTFRSKREAEFVANKVIEKLVKNRGELPALTVDELKQWGVIPKEQS